MHYSIEITIGNHANRIDGSWDYRPDSGMHPCDELLDIVKCAAPEEVLLARGYGAEIQDTADRAEAVRAAAVELAADIALREVAREADSNEFMVRGDIMERGVKVSEFYASAHVRNWTRVK